MSFKMLFSLSFFAASCLAAPTQQSPGLHGVGQISVIATSDISKADTSNRAGCLDVNGQFTSDTTQCGTFTITEPNPVARYFETDTGPCGWFYSSKPINSDSIYGKQDKAFECRSGLEQYTNDIPYTINGLNALWICTGDTDCYQDAKSVPPYGATSLTWVYRWGSDQRGITPGHTQVAWLWEPSK